jgi:hypothetical protein
MPDEDDLDLAVGKLSGSSDRVLHDRLPSRAAQARLPAGAHHAAAQSSQAALRACKHGRHGRAQAWTARTAWYPQRAPEFRAYTDSHPIAQISTHAFRRERSCK